MPTGNFEFTTTPVVIANSQVNLFEQPDSSIQAPGPFYPTPSNQLIETDQPCRIRFDWDQIAGAFWLVGGTWHFDVWLEEMGPGEASPGHFTGTMVAAPVNGTYSFNLNIGANTIAPGVYRITVAQQFWSLGQPRALAMFGDLGLVRFTQVVP